MAKLFVVAVFDSAVQAFSRPLFVPAIAVAVRSFTDEVNRKADDNPLYAHPDDYHLSDLGTFDEETGVFQQVEIRVIARAKDVRAG